MSSIFTEALSLTTCETVLEQYKQFNTGYGYSSIQHLSQPTTTQYFPIRKCWRQLSDELIELLKQELWTFLDVNSVAICGEGGAIEVKNNFRLYESEYGIVKPHRDLPMCGDDTHTCLIYLTDSFEGGHLTVEDEQDLNPITYVPKVSQNLSSTPFLTSSDNHPLICLTLFPSCRSSLSDWLLHHLSQTHGTLHRRTIRWE